MHIGSGTDLAHLAQVCSAMEKAALSIGRTITTVSAGGGLPTPYREGQAFVDVDQYFKLWDATRNRLEDLFGHKLTLEIEPGRYLVAESGYLVTEIRAVKQMGGNTFYLLDAGFNNLARPILYGAYDPRSICRAGASTLAEIAASGKAALLVPLPFAADDHQVKNARSIERSDDARVLLDSELSATRLFDTVNDMLPRIEEYEQRARSLAHPRAAETIVDTLIQCGKK